jgi:D-alanyl-D-alanine dipeptidase
LQRKISLSEPVTELRHVKIVECGEELADFLARCPDLKMDRPRFNYQRATVLRSSVAEKICQADRLLPGGYRLAIVEGWRPPYIQRRMYQSVWNSFAEKHPDWSEVQLRRVVNRFTAPLNNRVPPPHTTGGAVDLALTDSDGNVLDMTSPFDQYDSKCWAFAAPGLSQTARGHRDIMAAALLQTGLTNYPSEYWHWSYGDQGWAYRGSKPNAIYGPVVPNDWSPNVDDDIEGPLEWIEYSEEIRQD